MSKVISLNEIYATKDRMHYWCNACGDINLPSDGDSIIIHSEDELTLPIRHLYETYWSELHGFQEYVVTIDGKNGMAIGYLFDECFKEDICDRWGVSFDSVKPEIFTEAAKKTAEWLFENLAEGVSVLLGLGTDPIGDEILVFVPEEICATEYEKVCGLLDVELAVYDQYENFCKKERMNEGIKLLHTISGRNTCSVCEKRDECQNADLVTSCMEFSPTADYLRQLKNSLG